MGYFAGLDVSLEETAICIVDNAGLIVRGDARGIAQIMRTGWYRAVHVKTPSCRTWRALLTARRMVMNKRRDVENGVRALLREAGLKVGTPSRKNFATRVGELVADDPVLAALAGSLLSVIDVMTREVDRLTKRVLDEVRVEPTCRRLMTVQGVGRSPPLRSAQRSTGRIASADRATLARISA